jgi:hypothetical protein
LESLPVSMMLAPKQLGEETSVGQLFALSRVGDLDEPRSHGGQSQGPAGLVDAGVGGLVGWTHEEFLAACLQREVAAREAHGGEGRIRAARFPGRKSLGDSMISARTDRLLITGFAASRRSR